MTEWQKQLGEFKRSLDRLRDAQVRQYRMVSDLLYNLDTENMPAVKELIESYRNEAEASYAALSVRADENGAVLDMLAETQTEQGRNLAEISARTDVNEADIEALASTQTEQGTNLAEIAARTDENSAAIGLTAENLENGAYLILKVNSDGSAARIGADKLELSGYARFSDLENEGSTVINGANIQTGTVKASCLETGGTGATGVKLDDHLMFNAGARSLPAVNSRYIFFADPAVCNVFIGINGGAEAGVLRIHAADGVIFDSFAGERPYLGSRSDDNRFITKAEMDNAISAALGGGAVSLMSPQVYVADNDSFTFGITNPNGFGTVVYRTYWVESGTGREWYSDEVYSNSSEIEGYLTEFPPGGGVVGVEAWVEYAGNASDTEVAETVCA